MAAGRLEREPHARYDLVPLDIGRAGHTRARLSRGYGLGRSKRQVASGKWQVASGRRQEARGRRHPASCILHPASYILLRSRRRTDRRNHVLSLPLVPSHAHQRAGAGRARHPTARPGPGARRGDGSFLPASSFPVR
ncbi:MAG: hypothetical protein DRI80_14475 [Chloroflexota bacterium]|nr:MAG: hypothetical protein DRI80_14475 [Chloroflexota bacterium]